MVPIKKGRPTDALVGDFTLTLTVNIDVPGKYPGIFTTIDVSLI
jgi:hypothetical protein